MKECLGIWEERWSNSEDGRLTFEIHNTPSTKRIESYYYLNQIITDHGIFGAYQSRIHGKNPICEYSGDFQTINHLIISRPQFEDIRLGLFFGMTFAKDWYYDYYRKKITRKFLVMPERDKLNKHFHDIEASS